MKVQRMINVEYKATSDPEIAQKWLNTLPDIFSSDFETAIRYTDEQVAEAKVKMLDTELSKKERVAYQVIANATALGHPYHCTITHCSIAYSNKKAYVFIIDNQKVADVLLGFLTTTEKTQIWHNYCYDGKFLCYYANGNAKKVEDTQILAKTLINHVQVFKAKTGLKHLMGEFYGDWGISADNFTLAQQYDESVIKYAAIDACATFKLWEHLNDFTQRN